ncbi:unnamed protein product [Vitrella brassicaformis CCMP3155]|uniref:Glutamine amidotransferase type-2 domain-containing protein n=1 Tax=Vitrella brassicaformis (strain CCMP3155) TaxID=1169540 RepID=A0A0G4FKQ4_VITBC|nr:unnamed protein product [Vitrella brassicaformis CCMP3155]|eukprot:CEM13916.1 unnamed protein product [Vitrella brassicaformis CCMP3155]
MCGILWLLTNREEIRLCRTSLPWLPNLECVTPLTAAHMGRLLDAIKKRGPDHPDGHECSTDTDESCGGNGFVVDAYGSVLQLRGDVAVRQPLRRSQDGDQLLSWNGEIFGGLRVGEHDNDAQRLFECISSVDGGDDEALNVLDAIQGPFAFAWLRRQEQTQQLWFGRDKLGRRSLMVALILSMPSSDGVAGAGGGGAAAAGVHGVMLSSVGCQFGDVASFSGDATAAAAEGEAALSRLAGWPGRGYYLSEWVEVPVDGLTILSLSHTHAEYAPLMTPTHRPWPSPLPFFTHAFWPLACVDGETEAAVDGVSVLRAALMSSVAERVHHLRGPECGGEGRGLGVLFSGGLDSTVLAAMAATVLDVDTPIELLNVCFDPNEAPDRLTALASYEELMGLFPRHDIRLVCIDVDSGTLSAHECAILEVLGCRSSHMDFNIGAALCFASRGVGRLASRRYISASWYRELLDDATRMQGIWAAAKISPEAPDPAGGGSAGGGGESGPSSCVCCHAKAKPGCVHQTCRLCCVKLQRACALTETEIGLTQVLPSPSPFPSSQPSAGEVLAAIHARWTEAVGPGRAPSATCRVHKERGSGDRQQQQQQQQDDRERTTPWRFDPQWYYASSDVVYRAASRVLLVGSGADELLGGYGRHQTACRHSGMEGLRDEMLIDVRRLWQRNLGRDDRCLAAHGREARHPFLAEDVIAAIGKLPFAVIMGTADHTNGTGGRREDKWLLRQVARQMGLTRCAQFKKRAIQFGSRSAKETNRSHFESNRKADGSHAYRPTSISG